MKSFVLLLALLCLGGCSLDDAIARADSAAHAATVARAQVDAGVKQAEETAATLRMLAKNLDAEKAARVLDQADALIVLAKSAIPAADAAIATSSAAIKAAKDAQAAGGTWLVVLLAVLGVGIPGGSVAATMVRGVIANLRTAVQQREAAITVTARHADRMEEAASDIDITNAKLQAIAEQEALGVKSLIAILRQHPPERISP